MSVIFSPNAVSLLRTLAEESAELEKSLSQPASEVFLAKISGGFHDLESANYDFRVRRTVKFAVNEVRQGCRPIDAVERLETSLENHGVAWFMLDLKGAREIADLEKMADICDAETAKHFARAKARPGDLIANFSHRRYEDYVSQSLCVGICLVRANRIVCHLTHIRS